MKGLKKSNLSHTLGFILITFAFSSVAQSVGVNDDGSNPDPSAILDIKSHDRGLLIPRMDSTARIGISMPAEGLMVYDTTTHSFWFFNNIWKEVTGADNDWYLSQSFQTGDVDDDIYHMGNAAIGLDSALSPLTVFGDSGTTVLISSNAPTANSDTLIVEQMHLQGDNLGVRIGRAVQIIKDTLGREIGLFNNIKGHSAQGQVFGGYNLIDINEGFFSRHGQFNRITGNATGSAFGTLNRIETPHAGFIRGTQNVIVIPDTATAGTIDGTFNFLQVFADIATTGTSNSLNGWGDAEYTGVKNNLLAQGSGRQIGVQNIFGSTSQSELLGVYQKISGTTDEAVYGLFDSINITGIGTHYGIYHVGNENLNGQSIGAQFRIYTSDANTMNQFGTRNELTGMGHGEQYGAYTYIDNTGNGRHTGLYNELNGDGTGYHYGIRNRLSGNGTGIQIGVSTSISNQGPGIQKGMSVFMDGEGDGTRYGSDITIYGTGDGTHYGTYYDLQGWGSGRHYGVYNNIDGVGTGIHYGIFNNMEADTPSDKFGSYQLVIGSAAGAGDQYGIFNEMVGGGSGLQIGSRSEMKGSGSGIVKGYYSTNINNEDGIHYGIHNEISGSGAGDHLGSMNKITGTGIGNHYGTRSELEGNGSGGHYGTYNLLTGAGTGIQYGYFTTITNSGASNLHIGGGFNLGGSGDGQRFGVRTAISSDGNGQQYGTYNVLGGDGTGEHFGTYNLIEGNGTGNHFGSYQLVQSTGAGNLHASLNSVQGNGTGVHYGNYTNLTGDFASEQYGALFRVVNDGDNPQYGTLNYLAGTGAGTHTGVKSELVAAANGIQRGFHSIILNSGNSTHFGIQNELSGSGSGTHYGTYNSITGEGDGIRYGTYNFIGSSGAGNHVAGFFDAPGGTNDFAAIFNRGNVVVNEDGGGFYFRVEGITEPNALVVNAGLDNNVGIGTDAPSSDLEVVGPDNSDAIEIDNGKVHLRHHYDLISTDRDFMFFLLDADKNQTNTVFALYKDVTESIGSTASVQFGLDGQQSWYAGGGDFGINNTNPQHPLDMASGAHVTAGGVWTNASDISKKKNINEIQYGLAEVLQLQPKSYTYKVDGSRSIGFIAQEIEKIIPEVVSGENGDKGVAYGLITAVLVEAVKEQNSEIEKLKHLLTQQSEMIELLMTERESANIKPD